MTAMAVFMMAAISLQAQNSPNGIGTGSEPITPVVDQKLWNRDGNALSNTSGNMLGSTNAYPIRICTNNTERIYIDTTGSIGINTTSPLQMLHVVEGNILISASSERAPGSTNGSILFGDEPTSSNPYGRWGIEYVGSTNEGYGLNFWKPYNTSGGFMNNVLFLKDNGNVGIGTNNPQAKLAVNGGVLAREIRVSVATSDWPDYVFSPDYTLMSLAELEQFISVHHHLPGVPSAQMVEDLGSVDLAEMNVILLRKVEEMTLRIIELEKRLQKLEK